MPVVEADSSVRQAEEQVGRRSWTGLAMVGLVTVVVVECVRVLFSVGYHEGESLGNLVAGMIVVALFATPLLAGPLRRVLPPGALLVTAVVALGAGRLALQATGDVSLALVGATTAVGLLAFALATVAVHRHTPEGSTGIAVACTLGLATDTLVRATGTTWDIVWRHDLVAWVLAVAMVGALVAVTLTGVGAGVVPDEDDGGGALPSFLLWPYLYLALLYTQSPAFLDSSAGVSYAVGLAVALGTAALALVVIVAVARHGLPRIATAVIVVGLAVVAFMLPVATGSSVAVLTVLAQAATAALLGSATGPARHEARDRIAAPTAAFAGGGVWVATAMLLFALHTLQPLPFSNRFLPAAVGLSMALALLTPSSTRSTARFTGRARWALPAVVAAAAVVAPLVVAASWPSPAHPDVADRPIRVLTFNIEQGLTLGQLHLEQMARFVDDADPDVVMMEEVGRGWSLSGMTDDAEWFSRRLGMPYAWSPAADHQFGNVVFSRLPITDQQVLALGKGNGTQDRSAVFVIVDVGGGRELTVIGTHLMNGSQPSMHESRAQAYRDILDHWGGRSRTVLLGDLNTYPRDVPPGWPELDIPLDAGFGTNQDLDQCTMPTSNQNCPDWIFTTGDLGLSPVTVVVDRPDHRPITAEVTVGG